MTLPETGAEEKKEKKFTVVEKINRDWACLELRQGVHLIILEAFSYFYVVSEEEPMKKMRMNAPYRPNGLLTFAFYSIRLIHAFVYF